MVLWVVYFLGERLQDFGWASFQIRGVDKALWLDHCPLPTLT